MFLYNLTPKYYQIWPVVWRLFWLIWMICWSLYDRVIPHCGCFYIRSKSFCLQVQGILFSLCCLVTTPTGVPASVGTPHLTIIALCNHKVRPSTTDTRQKEVLKAKPGEKRLFSCFHKPPCAQAPYKDHGCISAAFRGSCAVYYDIVCFECRTISTSNTEMLRKQLERIYPLFGGGHVVFIRFDGWAGLMSEVPYL